ncbi:oxygenase MpaB family protein [Phenylobacterium sp.]|uniref:oxygenase MpaB family protein n=1 Tax=Phenylobacterium sp. TaxID=1871053 RepID=UPI002897AC9C|nr:oxygenase MpaB family protein [Phenylobacterium sp.]
MTCGTSPRAAGPVERLAGALDRRLFGPSRIDYSRPKGDPGLYGPDSMAWRVHANPVALAVGGVAAVILELAEPRVRSGVWEHSTFARDPLTRIRRTGEATMITTYGPTAEAQARIAMVARMHQRVSGSTPDGEAYHALDPELATWVHVTAAYGFLEAYRRYVDPAVSRADQDRYYAEGAAVGRAFGALDPPTSVAGVERALQAMRPRLAPHPIVTQFLGIVRRTSPMGPVGRALQPLVVEASLDLLPPGIAHQLGLRGSPSRLAAANLALRAMAAAARLAPGDIPRQAHARMGRRA